MNKNCLKVLELIGAELIFKSFDNLIKCIPFDLEYIKKSEFLDKIHSANNIASYQIKQMLYNIDPEDRSKLELGFIVWSDKNFNAEGSLLFLDYIKNPVFDDDTLQKIFDKTSIEFIIRGNTRYDFNNTLGSESVVELITTNYENFKTIENMGNSILKELIEYSKESAI